VLDAARQAGLEVPGDLSIVGYDDTPLASRVWPRLTTVHVPIRDMGYAAGRLLLADPTATATQRYTSFTPDLVVRESTAPPA